VSGQRYEVRFDVDALAEYQRLDNSLADIVDKALERLEVRADEIGRRLENKYSTKLLGCKEIKLRGAGLRIVFSVTDQVVEVLRVVYVLTIERRELDYVFRVADRRLRRYRIQVNVRDFLERSPKREQRRRLWHSGRKTKPSK
jgi:mRNA interferase RelE/StbE